MALDLVVAAPRAVVDGAERGCVVGILDGRIAAVEPYGTELDAAQTVRLDGDVVLLPGLVDTHVHVNEPGRTDWEGFAHATRAAAAGGVTTIVDMPLNSVPPTLDLAALETKRLAAQGSAYVDVGFWGGAVPDNRHDLQALWEAGVFGFKCFLADSGVEEFPALDEAALRATAEVVASFGGLLLVHAEDPDSIHGVPPGTSYAEFAASRPESGEVAAVRAVIETSRATGCRMHVVHLAAGSALPLLHAAHDAGVPVTAETCPHYLTFAADEVPDGATAFKCCPPIRGADNRDRLWEGLANGTIGTVVSDHSPCPADLKAPDTGDFAAAWGGISSLQLGLAAVWTGARDSGRGLADVVRWMATGPANRVGLSRKGRIAVGADADLCVLAPDESFVVDPAALQHRHPVTPYAGRTLVGVVRETWLAGPPHRPRRGAARPAAEQRSTPMTDFHDLPDVASRALGGSVVHANDELFAARENLVTPGPPAFDPAAFGPRGKVYDGWETRRRRQPGNDFAIVRLGVRAVVEGVVVDTANFTGNYPPQVSLDSVDLDGYPSVEELLGARVAAARPGLRRAGRRAQRLRGRRAAAGPRT